MISLQHRLEYAALIGFKGAANLLPYRAALFLAWLLALLGFYGLRYRRAEAIRRIRSVFGASCSTAQARAIAWEAFRNFIFTAIESMRGERVDEHWIRAHVDDRGMFQIMQARAAAGQGAVAALPHMGSWELAGATYRVNRIPLFSIAAKQKNPLFNDYINRQRSRSGIEILVRGELSLKTVLRNLKQGKCFAILPDLRNPTPALAVPFLGGTANVGGGMALFARQANVPIYPIYLVREGWSRHIFHMLEPIFPDPALSRDEDLLRMTRAVFAHFDRAIRANPGQWFWYNKRWILDPVAPDAVNPPPPASPRTHRE
jgi:lauroyl/myristoyl acyltransferase